MIETTNLDGKDPDSEQSGESFSPEAGGTSVSFRPGPMRFLPEFERRPWWVAPGAIVIIPLAVMLVAAWAIPDRIGSEASGSTQSFPAWEDTRSSPSRGPSDPSEERLESERAVPAHAPSSSGSRRARETSSPSPRRGFSPVREREESPMMVMPIQVSPPPAIPEPPPEPPIAQSNGARGGDVSQRASRPEEPEQASESEAAAEVASEPEEAPQADTVPAVMPTPPEGEEDQNQPR